MTIFAVDISCRSPTRDYTALFDALRAAHGQPLLDTRWLIDVRQDLKSVFKALQSHMAPRDGLWITELAPETRWMGFGLGAEVKAWIAARSVPASTPRDAMVQSRKH